MTLGIESVLPTPDDGRLAVSIRLSGEDGILWTAMLSGDPQVEADLAVAATAYLETVRRASDAQGLPVLSNCWTSGIRRRVTLNATVYVSIQEHDVKQSSSPSS